MAHADDTINLWRDTGKMGKGEGLDDLSASDGRACAVMGLTQSLDAPRTYRRDGTKHASFGACRGFSIPCRLRGSLCSCLSACTNNNGHMYAMTGAGAPLLDLT